MNFCLPPPVLFALKTLNEAGYEAYVVGGCVRDILMGRTPYDWDITTSALPEQTLTVFNDQQTITTGLKHGTVTVMIENMPLEITTYRLDGTYSDGRHPDSVVFTPSLEEDLKRRDFTINAMAYHPDLGLIDFHNGKADLEFGILRCVGDPSRRFNEDALRILRGIRFSSCLGFAIEPLTAEAIHTFCHNLHQVAIERIQVEFIKSLCGDHADTVLLEYQDVISEFLPLNIIDPNRFTLLKRVSPTPLLRLSVLFWGENTDDVACCLKETLRLSHHLAADVCALIGHANSVLPDSDSQLLYLLNQLGVDLSLSWLTVRSAVDLMNYTHLEQRIHHLVDSGHCFSLAQLAVNGTDLIQWGLNPGPNIGDTLNHLLSAVIEGNCENNIDALKEYVKKKPVQ